MEIETMSWMQSCPTSQDISSYLKRILVSEPPNFDLLSVVLYRELEQLIEDSSRRSAIFPVQLKILITKYEGKGILQT
jgi:hypothetical protein